MDSIIFDLDGTLWNPVDTVQIAWNKALRTRKNLETQLTREQFEQTMGLQMDEISKIFFPTLTDEERASVVETCTSMELELLREQGGHLYEDVANVLSKLSKRYKLYIVSNCGNGYIESFYSHHKLDKYFLDFENPGRTGLSKGENIQLIMKRNYLKSPIYVGDTKGDLEAANFAGIPFVFASYGFGQINEQVNTICRLKDLASTYLEY